MKGQFTINGNVTHLEFEPGESLLDVLRAAGLFGTKRGCEEGTCCSCVVLIEGEPQMACLRFAASAQDCQITTIEGLDVRQDEPPHPLVSAFAEHGAVQCGYCTPAMILTTKALLERIPDPDELTIRRELDGHLCRCTGYVKQVEAIKSAAKTLREGADR